MSNDEELKGRAKEATGKLTGDDDLEREGQADQVKAKIKDAVDSVKDAARKAKDSATEDDR